MLVTKPESGQYAPDVMKRWLEERFSPTHLLGSDETEYYICRVEDHSWLRCQTRYYGGGPENVVKKLEAVCKALKGQVMFFE